MLRTPCDSLKAIRGAVRNVRRALRMRTILRIALHAFREVLHAIREDGITLRATLRYTEREANYLANSLAS